MDLRNLSKEDRRKLIWSKESKEPLATAVVCFTQMASYVGGVIPSVVHPLKIAGGVLLDDVVYLSSKGVATLSPTTAIGVGEAVQGGFMVAEIGYYGYKWAVGEIDSHEFKMKSVEAIVGSLSSMACATAGSLIGSFICPGLGTVIGGVIGSLIGIGKKLVFLKKNLLFSVNTGVRTRSIGSFTF